MILSFDGFFPLMILA